MSSPLARYLDEHGKRGTQLALATKIGVSEATVSRYAAGLRKPGLAHALAIEKATKGAVKVSAWPHLRALFASLRKRVTA